MWNEGEKMFRGQSMNLYSTSSGVSSNMSHVPPNDVPDRRILDEVSRKRKAAESDFVSTFGDCASPRFWASPVDEMGCMIPRGSTSQHNVGAIGSERKLSLRYPDHISQSARPTDVDTLGNYHSYNMNNSLISSRGREENFQPAVDGTRSCAFHQNEPSFSFQTPIGGIQNLADSQHVAYDMATHSGASKFESCYDNKDQFMKTPAAFRSNSGMDFSFIDGKSESSQHISSTMSSQNLPSESSQFRAASENFNRLDGAYLQSLIELQKNDQNVGFTEDKSISIITTNSGQTSVSDGSEISGSKCPATGLKSSNSNCSDILSSQLDVRGRYMPHLPVLAEISGREEAFTDDGTAKYLAYAYTNRETDLLEADRTEKETNCHSLRGRSPLGSESTHVAKPTEVGGAPISASLDEQRKSTIGKISPVIVEKLWDGSLQMNTSTTVSAVAFFKSGEKAQDIDWSERIEVKGKVRLHAFEKFIQELPRSRNRALMVISLRWKIGSSKAGLVGMKEVAKGYRESGRVGFANICPGIDLYVCPRSDTIITILAKYGYFKGMAAVEEDQDSFIGCVIWRRTLPSSNSVPQISVKKKVPLLEQPIVSPLPSTVEKNSPLPKQLESDNKQTVFCLEEPDNIYRQPISDTGNADLNSGSQTNENNVTQSSNELNNTNSTPEAVPTLHSAAAPPQLQYAMEPEAAPLQENMEVVKPAKIRSAGNPDLASELMQPVLPGPPALSDTQLMNAQLSKDLHGSPLRPLNSPLKQVKLSGAQRTGLSSEQDSPLRQVQPPGAHILSSGLDSPLKQVQPPGAQWNDLSSHQDSPLKQVLPSGVQRTGLSFQQDSPRKQYQPPGLQWDGSSSHQGPPLKQVQPSGAHWTDLSSQQDQTGILSRASIPTMHIGELKSPDSCFEPARAHILSSEQDTQLRQVQHPGAHILISGQDSPLKQVQPSGAQWSDLSTHQDSPLKQVLPSGAQRTGLSLQQDSPRKQCQPPGLQRDGSSSQQGLPTKQVQPSGAHWTGLSSQRDETGILSRASIPQGTIPSNREAHQVSGSHTGSFPDQRNFYPVPLSLVKPPASQNSPDTPSLQDPTKGRFKTATPNLHMTEPEKTDLGFEPTRKYHPRMPQPLSCRQLRSKPDDDDLPEFDFSSACGTSDAPLSEFPRSRTLPHFPNDPKFKLRNDVISSGGGPLPPVMPMSKPSEVAQRSQSSAVPGMSFSEYHGIMKKTGEVDSENKNEFRASQLSQQLSTTRASNGSHSPRPSSNFPPKNRWDDDDDMPEWCPPDLELPLASTSTRPPSNLRPSFNRTPMPPPSATPFYQTPSQSSHQSGLLGPRPVGSNPQSSHQSGLLGSRSEMRSSVFPNADHASRSQDRQYEIKPRLDSDWRWRRS